MLFYRSLRWFSHCSHPDVFPLTVLSPSVSLSRCPTYFYVPHLIYLHVHRLSLSFIPVLAPSSPSSALDIASIVDSIRYELGPCWPSVLAGRLAAATLVCLRPCAAPVGPATFTILPQQLSCLLRLQTISSLIAAPFITSYRYAWSSQLQLQASAGCRSLRLSLLPQSHTTPCVRCSRPVYTSGHS